MQQEVIEEQKREDESFVSDDEYYDYVGEEIAAVDLLA